ncbi:precorrin-2 dehydrogenase/sirohydrochlorin ferrochelatase family protein [Carboxylicivirga sp. N1Y90]|uniref:precorrin-2 dehydrogenase/sirohydrochlorin ferrochelatase family protein n=1 Tax=Carboxylicivirga fragile TaxID=3417571 RepID=UPI003D338DA3|nr:bifunctional precorrin-2 dehydrogenase/sirohydrochlorin ferrochelatase [Marinilabiliaceae bacterium N1Y90]
MNFLPISIDIARESILIIGGGKVAIHKIESLEKFTHNIKIIASDVLPEIRERKFIEIVEKAYEPEDLKGHLLVYAATNNHELNSQIREDALNYRCLVNVVDKPDNCDFISPAIYRQKNMTVAVSSNGENVYAAIEWRDKVKEIAEQGQFPEVKSKKKSRCGDFY